MIDHKASGKIQKEFSQAQRIIQAHFGMLVETDVPVSVESVGEGIPGFFAFMGREGKAPVVTPRSTWEGGDWLREGS